MFPVFISAAFRGFAALAGALPLGLKPIKYFIDSTIRDQVTPIPGSVLYSDLWVAVEHSGIYVGSGRISNIVVEGTAESAVRLSTARSFTSKSKLGRKIYVSCDRHGAVGDSSVAEGAEAHVGEQSFYGLVIKNCHQFSTRCVNYAGTKPNLDSVLDVLADWLLPDESWEPTLKALKKASRAKLGASKWRLWDWDNDIRDNPPPEPDWEAQTDAWKHLALTPEVIEHLRAELAASREYEDEISDEAIPENIRAKLIGYGNNLAAIDQNYREVELFLRQCPGAGFSYADLTAGEMDWQALALQLQKNPQITDLIRKLGRAYISEEKKRQSRVPQPSRSEVHGTHRSADLQRLLPSELVNLEDETLEALFYARLLEQNLLSYELSGTQLVPGEETEVSRRHTGPVVACLDTSGSMQGEPLHKAKAMLLATANILQKEQRSLHVILFGERGEIREYALQDASGSPGLLRFLQQGFGGGTDFETPLQRALEIISEQDAYHKADILMVSDGDCSLSEAFVAKFLARKAQLECSVYSVLCAGQRVSDSFSDEVISL